MNKYEFTFSAYDKRGDYHGCETAYVYADTMEEAERIFDETARNIYSEMLGVAMKKL